MANSEAMRAEFLAVNTDISPSAKTQQSLDQVFIEDLILEASIGVYKHELTQKQPVQINIIIDLSPLQTEASYAITNIVCYDQICRGVKAILDSGHIDLVETLAENIASLCLNFQRVLCVDVRVSKPRAIQETTHVGVRIVRVK